MCCCAKLPSSPNLLFHQYSHRPEMLSRLSGLANTVLQELSGDGSDAQVESSATVSEPGMESREEMPKDILERLAHTEQLAVQLKDLIREKDARLQQKEVELKEEREAADAKLKKLKLQAKAKLAALNKRIEELTEQGSVLPAKSLPEEQLHHRKLQNNQRTNEEQKEEVEALKQKLQEQEETVRNLMEQLAVTRESLTDTQAKQAAQLSSLQEVIREKDALLEEQVHQHCAELHQAVPQSDREAEMQQNLRTLQRMLEEQEAGLLGRTQVVELLQRELHGAEEQNKTLLDQCQRMEAELSSLKKMLDAEREESQSLVEKMELELAEKKLSFHQLQEEVQYLSEQLEQAARTRTELESECRAQDQKYKLEVEEQKLHIAYLQMAEQELRTSHDALLAQNGQLLRDIDRLLVQSTENSATIQHLQDELTQKSEEFVHCQTELKLLKSELVMQVSQSEEQAVSEQNEIPLQKNVVEQEDEKRTLLLPTAALERLKAENETLCFQHTLLEAQHEAVMSMEDSNQTDSIGTDSKLLDLLTQEGPSCSGYCSPGPDGHSAALVNNEPQSPQPSEDIMALTQTSTEEPPRSSSGQSAEEGGPAGILEYLSAAKHKELSVLLLELREAQEEITFLKGQLLDPGSQTPAMNWAEEEINVMGGRFQPRFLEGEGQKTSSIQSELSSDSLTVEEVQKTSVLQEETNSFPEVLLEHITHSGGEMDAVQGLRGGLSAATTELGLSQPQELTQLQRKIMELQTSLQKSEELYKKDSEEKVAEINRLTQLAEACRKNAEKSNSALHVLTEERDQLLSQMKELCTITELKELEGNLMDSEKQRLSDYESRTVQHSLLKEQIQSLKNEYKSKERKIEALQKDLDEAQLQLSKQDALAKSLRNQLQKTECEVLDLQEHLRKTTVKTEELTQGIVSKELDAVRLEQLLAERTGDNENLQQALLERDQQVTEISITMSAKIGQLNEEKFALGSELKGLKEQMSLLLKTEAIRDQHTEQTGEAEDLCLKCKGSEQQSEMMAAVCKEREVLGSELEHLKKENEQVKRKLQAALINRKELLKKVNKLENELVQVRGTFGAEAQKAEVEGTTASGLNAEGDVTPESQAREMSLMQLLSEREAELQSIQKDLLEKEAAEAQLQALIEEMKKSLQDKTNLIDSKKAEIMESQSAIQKLITANKCLEGSDPAASKEDEVNSPAAAGFEEHHKSALKERISALEQEKDQLQKKLQEALTSRKDTIKKAQEKDRHHREQLKQQKDDYNLLQEQFDKQSKEKESIQDQLRQLQAQRECTESHSLPGIHFQRSAESVLDVTQELAGNLQHSDRSQGWIESSCLEVENTKTNNLLQETDVSMEEFKAELKNLQTKKDELEFTVSHLESDLACKSEAVIQLQEHIAQLLSEMEGLKSTCHQVEAHAPSLQAELEKSQTEISRQDNLKALKQEVEELKNLMSKKDEEIELLNLQLREKSKALTQVQRDFLENEDLIKTLHSQLEKQTSMHEEQSKRLKAELLELQQRPDEGAEEAKYKNQVQRKLQAALISRKEALKESTTLKEELATAKMTIETLSLRLADMESQVCDWDREKDALSEKLVGVTEEREKLIAEVDKALMENQNLDSSCESLKLALEGITQEKEKLEKEIESLKCLQAAESSEWQEKYKELQKEYETLLQSYENVSNEAERIHHVLETIRQEKQDIFSKLKGAEAKKREVDKQLQEAEQEMEGMKEKMRKFAKSKQQKILELEEENERLRAELHPTEGDLNRDGDMSLLTSTSLREALESSKRDCQSLSIQLETLMAEKGSLGQEVQVLKHQLQCTESKLKENLDAAAKHGVQKTIVEEANQAVPTAALPLEVADNQVDLGPCTESPEPLRAGIVTEAEEKLNEGSRSHDEINTYLQQIVQLTERITELEENRMAAEKQVGSIFRSVETLGEEKKALESQVAAKVRELNTLQETVAKMELTNRQIEEQLVRMTKLKETLEAEKDDLEERLMNQLAELNGSIGNYQQDMADLQTKNEQLKSELQSLQRMVNELEEEKRQLMREKTEAEAETQKEYAEKLKCAQKGDGSRTHAKELQELLKQKQQEVKQLQKDCIKSQEKISSLERTVKALQFVQSESQKELAAAKENLAKACEDTKKAQAELASCRILLDDTQSETARILAESLKVREELQANKEHVKIQMKRKDEDFERRLGQEKDKHSKEINNMEEKLASLQRERDSMEGTVRDIQDSLHRREQEAKQLQGSLNKNLAQLAAFTRSMTSLQDDRDRVIDESKKWEKLFTEAIQKKEEEIHAREETCTILKDQMRQMSMHIEELQIHVSSLEHNKQDWESESQRVIQQHQKMFDMLQEENKGLVSQLEEYQRLYTDSQNELQKLDAEIKCLRDQLADLHSSFTKSEVSREEMESMVKQQEASIQNCKFNCEQLEADLQASKDLTNKLHKEIGAKDQKIISLLAAKEEAVMTVVSELQQQHSEEVKRLEDRLGKKEEEKVTLKNEREKALDKLNHLMETMKITREESKQQKAQLASFAKCMSSLQDDRDRVLRDYEQLEERHLVIILKKDQLIQEAAAENNKLKEEIRSFHSQVDDLNSENAKLNAELVRYREDLNQVISIKDSQQKQLLKTQLQRIQVLENEKVNIEGHLKESEHAVEDLRQCVEALKEDKQSMSKEIENITFSLSQIQSEMTALPEGRHIVELETQLKDREKEVQELSSKLALTQKRVAELEEELVHVQRNAAEKVGEAQDKLKNELKHLHHDAGIMRNETETAEERVAELARDLMEMEQKLLTVTEENKDLKAQIQSFGNSMSALQDSWDQTNEELQVLGKKYSADLEKQQCLVQSLQKEMAQLQEEQHSTARERDSLISELTALKNTDDKKGLLFQLEELNQQLRVKDEELFRLSLELEESSSQIKSFSRAMASLQDERDRLLSELNKAHRVEEVKQQTAVNSSSSPAEVQSLKKALSSLQDDRDRLLTELKNLQQQYLQIGMETAEVSHLKARLQEYRQEADKQYCLQEQLRQEMLSCQQELDQLRQEKTTWEMQNKRAKEQYFMALADKDQQLSHLQRIVQDCVKSPLSKSQVIEEQHQRQTSPETHSSSETLGGDPSSLEAKADHLRVQLSDSLKELHQKELRIQQLNSKLSQIFEEKNALSIQLRGNSQNLRESHQHCREVLNRCMTLEKQLQELQSPNKDMRSLVTDAAPGAPQEKNELQRESYTPELQELQLRLSEAKQLHSSTKQDLRHLEEQLQEERDQRLAAEEAFSAAQDHIRRLESSEWASALGSSINVSPSHEHSLLIDSRDSSFSKTRSNSGLWRQLHSLFCSRTRLPLLVTVYLFMLHILLFLCFTGHL
ncbi:golgin subfamily B member 1 isoform X3 [Gopherus flavomarginatus]|uniref:golgin subfamily B member 1 isoform X3 n=1 Tax=Gopherus flavomarginatus TaxID=286002 RepID=UPI0021CC2727|nr:golgin subfamily B member 1 isoform X3 [Gopherus flavomarginatus]